ncbi:protein arginine N-methyltransferase 1-like [Armigeres subalbatus]|uniref:protein arginine N-methyltransferase 1-like n=1 Tax=Armigeres subalbatus TaxID=124917 RepID=UPI002ED4E9F3
MTTSSSSFSSLRPEDMTSLEYDLDPYAHFAAHESFLKDQVRSQAYRKAIYKNRHLFKGRIVLDVGCGMGILSMFAARAGAARVIAIDFSNGIDYAQDVVDENGLGHIITLVKARVESIDQLPHGITHVDIILSEWMGLCLLDGPMLDTVIYARNKWLNPNGGLMFPDRCTLYIAGIEDRKVLDERINWWDNVYGFDMSAIRRAAIKEPRVDTIHYRHMVTTCYRIKEIDMYTVDQCKSATGDWEFESRFRLTAKRTDFVHALVTYFNVEFTRCKHRTGFSTSPMTPFTHWKQMIFYLDEGLVVEKGELIGGRFSMKSMYSPGRFAKADFRIKLRFKGVHSDVKEDTFYKLR